MHAWSNRDDIHLICSRLAADPELLDHLWPLLSQDEVGRANKYRSEKHRTSFVVAHGLLRAILGACIGIESSAISYTYGPAGKPMLIGRESIQFNLAHSEDFIVCAVTDDRQLGVDIEFIRPLQELEGIAKQFFSETEFGELMEVSPEQRSRAFFECWTRKEAFVKALGNGLSHPLDQFQVTLKPGAKPELISIAGCARSASRWSLYDVAPSAEYAAALAVNDRDCCVREWRFETPKECLMFCTQG